MHDILFGIRLLYRRVGASIIIVLVLALGIGANTAMFTVTAVSQLGHAKLRPIFGARYPRVLVPDWCQVSQLKACREFASTTALTFRVRGVRPHSLQCRCFARQIPKEILDEKLRNRGMAGPIVQREEHS